MTTGWGRALRGMWPALACLLVAGVGLGHRMAREVVGGESEPAAPLTADTAAAADAPADVLSALARAGENRSELEQALQRVDGAQRRGMQYLIKYMPERDLRTLKAEFLVENVRYAYRAQQELPWGKTIPEEIFLNDVLPYANINERRDNWRKEFFEKFVPVVSDCQSAAEAAQRLNEKVFGMLNVRYSTQRRRADQGPRESMETGLASCTGLSILLSDACRAVAVPARLAGIPNWVNKRGNHTWIEVWDRGWHFTGAAEPSPHGLNHAWFQYDASLARADERRHAIYAASYRPTGLAFPMVWARDNDQVFAVNVTHRYAKPEGTPVKPGVTRVLVRVINGAGQRVAADVKITDAANAGFSQSGTSRDEGFDTNDILVFELPQQRQFRLEVTLPGKSVSREYATGKRTQDQIDIRL